MNEDEMRRDFMSYIHGPRSYEEVLASLNSGDAGPEYKTIDFDAPLLALEKFNPSEGAMKIDAFEKSIESFTLKRSLREEKLREIEEKYADLEKYAADPKNAADAANDLYITVLGPDFKMLKLEVWKSLKIHQKWILRDFLPEERMMVGNQLFSKIKAFTGSIDVAINAVHDYKLREHLMNILNLSDTYNPLLVLNRKKRKSGIRIMSEASYDRVIEYFDYMIRNEKLPKKIIPVPYFTVPKTFI